MDLEYPDHITVLGSLRGYYYAALMTWDRVEERYVPIWTGPKVSREKAKEHAEEKAEKMKLKMWGAIA